jgi:hypothetical protein
MGNSVCMIDVITSGLEFKEIRIEYRLWVAQGWCRLITIYLTPGTPQSAGLCVGTRHVYINYSVVVVVYSI